MKITLNDKINQFLNRCHANIANDTKNDFVGMHITKKNEKKVIKMLADAGIPEFQDSNNCPSLFLSVDEWENNPYHKNIHLDWIKDSHFTFERGKIAGFELFNSDVIQKDPNRELNDWMKLRAMDRNFDALYTKMIWTGCSMHQVRLTPMIFLHKEHMAKYLPLG